MNTLFFEYSDAECEALKRRDRKLARAMEKIGKIHRAADPDLFSSIAHHIIGQQISTKAQHSVWTRILELCAGCPNAHSFLTLGREQLQRTGITFKKADWLIGLAQKVDSGEFDLHGISKLSDQEAIQALVTLPGVGVWTAEMLLLFCLQRRDIFSYGDLAIHRGLRMVYRHRSIDRSRFERYRKRFSPYGSIASLYLWAVAGGALGPEITDPIPTPTAKKR